MIVPISFAFRSRFAQTLKIFNIDTRLHDKAIATITETASNMPNVPQYPQKASVEVAESVARTWPNESYPPIAILVRGQEVQVTGASKDGEWIHIERPIDGWMKIEQVRFADKDRSPQLTPAVFRLYLWIKAKPRLRVRASPDTESEIITHVMYGEMVEIDNLTSDKQWAHIIAPKEGWVNTFYLSNQPLKDIKK